MFGVKTSMRHAMHEERRAEDRSEDPRLEIDWRVDGVEGRVLRHGAADSFIQGYTLRSH